MDSVQGIVDWLNNVVWSSGIQLGDERAPFVVLALLGTGVL